MKVKNLLLSVTVAGILLCGATACKPAHEHVYGSWIDGADATCAEAGTLGHYHCDGCGKNFDAERNELVDIAVGATGRHDFTEKNVQDKYLATAATCSAAAEYYYSCSVCGLAGGQTFASGEPTDHTYETEWSYDDTGHWHAATCVHDTVKKDYAGHDLKLSADETEKTCLCGYTVDMVTALDTPTGFAYTDGKITFGAVKFATSYSVEISKGQTVVKSDSITAAEYDITALNLAAGKYEISVVAAYKAVKSEKATFEFNVLAVDTDVLLEAEDAVLNKNHISVDGVAHGGAYALGIDDCGQGLYFRYYAYEAAEKTVEVIYSTANAGSFMKFYVNGAYRKDVVFSENTGWFGDSKTSATASVKLNFAQGWNEIYLVKIGTAADTPAYGGNAQIDYIKIIGSGKAYDTAEFNMRSNSYKLEAECAQWHWADASMRPTNWEGNVNLSMGYALGEINAVGDGVKFNFKVAESGTYKIQLAFGGGAEADGIKIDVSVNGAADILRTVTGTGSHDSFKLDDGFTAEFTAGEWLSVDFKRAEGSNWFTVDYVLITRVAD